MIKTIISHDKKTAIARIRFEHNDVKVEQDFKLEDVVPGTSYIFKQMNIEFTEDHQLTAIDRLEEMIKNQIELGLITNPPEPLSPPILPPEEVVLEDEPTEENTTP